MSGMGCRPAACGATLAIALLATGCAGLVVRTTDSPAERHAKAVAHLALTVGTLAVFPKFQAEVLERERRLYAEGEAREKVLRHRRRWLSGILTARTGDELDELFGSAARRCLPREPDREVCTWATAGILLRALEDPPVPAGRVDAPPPSPPDPDLPPFVEIVVATCELPRDGAPRPPASCDVSFW